MTRKYSIWLFLVVAFLVSTVSYGQERKDSSVVVSTDKERIVQYGYKPTIFNIVATPTLDGFTASEKEQSVYLSSLVDENAKDDGTTGRYRAVPMRTAPSGDYAVGGIPLQEGVSPSGARTYSIPITTAPDAKLSPQLSISYNSQAGEGLAGYGWDLSGISKISLINKNIYYHGSARAAKSSDTDAVFALDGIPLVQNTDSANNADFPLVTASGHIIVRKNTNAGGYITSFDVRFPNGIQATYSLGYDVQNNYPSYPVTEMTDLSGNKVSFSYLKEQTNGSYRIDKIRYNYGADDRPLSQIDFSYNYNYSLPEKYFAGKKINARYYLSGIYSRNNGSLLSRLSFTYTERDNVFLLTEVGCSNGSTTLPPLRFDYGELNYWYSAENATLEKKNTFQYLTSAFTDIDCVYRRGKFVKNSFNDGMIIYPAFSNYDVRESHWGLFSGTTYLFGSPVSETQTILFVPQLGEGISNQVDASIVAEAGFQTIEAVDINADGVDELVKVNFNGITGNKTNLKFSVYKCNSSGLPTLSTTFTVSVTGTVTSGNYTSPYRREYYWGDFNGRGHAQLLTIAYNNNGYNYSQTCYAALIDLSSHVVVSESVLFDYSLTDGRNVLVMDIDNDGRSELCHARTDGMDILRLQANNSFAIEESTTSLSTIVLSNEKTRITDIDADGYVDVLWPGGLSSPIWYRYAYTGEEFAVSLMDIGTLEQNDNVMFIDINQDNYPDFVKVSGTSMGVRLNLNGHSFGDFRPSNSTISDTSGRFLYLPLRLWLPFSQNPLSERIGRQFREKNL